MTIILTIDNYDSLSDGGPIRYQAHEHGFEVGREQHLDWTLPDPERYISGRHCEFRYEDGAYWLYDVSSNGTFLNGSATRMKSPYRLAHGDRLSIGHYIVRVELDGDEAAVAKPAQAAGPASQPAQWSENIWDIGGDTPPPVGRQDVMPETPGRRASDFPNHFVDLPHTREREPQPWSPPESGMPEPQVGETGRIPARGSESPFGSAGSGEGFASAPAQAPTPLPSVHSPQPRASSARSAGAESPRAFMEALARGAGVSPDAFLGRDGEEVAHEIGEVLAVAMDNLAQLLKARAAAKAMTKSASRTMIGAADNNPLKFVPAASEAIEIMFRRNRSGYMGAKQSVEEAFADLKGHELATYAAMQKALARLLEDLAPDTIEAKVGGSAFPLKKGRAWDLFVSRWEQKSAGANGMLDAFLAYFAEAYDEASRKK